MVNVEISLSFLCPTWHLGFDAFKIKCHFYKFATAILCAFNKGSVSLDNQSFVFRNTQT